MPNELTYNEAVRRLEEIVSQIESGKLDIDALAECLKEAKNLILFCKSVITEVKADVEKIW